MGLNDLSVIAGILATLLGGAWALIKMFYSQKERIESLERKQIVDMISQTQTQIADLSRTVTSIREEFGREIELLKRETNELRIVQREHIVEMKSFGEAMLKVYRHFAGEKAPAPGSEKVEIGKDTWIIREKKKGGD